MREKIENAVRSTLASKYGVTIGGSEPLIADAVLDTLREPTEPMLVVFHDRIQIEVDPVNRECSVLNDRALWQAVIDAAKEGS